MTQLKIFYINLNLKYYLSYCLVFEDVYMMFCLIHYYHVSSHLLNFFFWSEVTTSSFCVQLRKGEQIYCLYFSKNFFPIFLSSKILQ